MTTSRWPSPGACRDQGRLLGVGPGAAVLVDDLAVPGGVVLADHPGGRAAHDPGGAALAVRIEPSGAWSATPSFRVSTTDWYSSSARRSAARARSRACSLCLQVDTPAMPAAATKPAWMAAKRQRMVLGRAAVAVEQVGSMALPSAWCTSHVGQRDQERDPVLVQRQHHDHHEEVEVGLGHAAGQVHHHRRRGHQRDRGGGRRQPGPVLAAGDPGHQHQQRDARALEQAVADGIALDDAVERHGDGVEQGQHQDRAVAGLPRLPRKGAPVGQLRAEALDPRQATGPIRVPSASQAGT